MSGRPKPQPDEAESLRQLIREAHEAIKDLKAAIREIRAERADHVAFLDDSLQLAVRAGTEQIANTGQAVIDHVQEQADQLAAHLVDLIGAGDIRELADVIVAEAARQLAGQLMLGIDEEGHPVIQVQPRRGEVFVTTDPALAPPGSIILDRR